APAPATPAAGEATVAPPAATVAAVAPAAEEFDLASIGLDATAAYDDKLQIYGFADFGYQVLNYAPSAKLASDTASFGTGNLNIYIAKNLTRRWRTLTEVRLLFAPNGGNNDGTFTSTATPDPANLYRPIEWGGIRIERAYVEYDLHPRLTIRAGHWLSPYGIWNVDHGSPTIISTFRPYVIGEEFIPEHQTGLHAFGSTYVGEYRVGYHATMSNGRSKASATSDPDRRPAFGGRLEVAAPWAGTVNLGVSAYAGRATAVGPSILTPKVTQDEVTLAADISWQHGSLHAQGEAMVRTRNYLAGQRAPKGAGFQADGRDLGMYVLVGYRFNHLWNVMPFASYEHYKPLEPTLFEEVRGGSVGLNFRPTPTVVLKAMGTVADTEGSGRLGTIGHLVILSSQIAWVF
nr:hypothetical protein [Myxococcota bacterium]